MYVIFIRNYKVKFILTFAAFLFMILALIFSHYIINNNISLKVTINNNISFSHPITFKVNNILVNEALSEEALKVNYSFKKPIEQNFINFDNSNGKFSVIYPTSFNLAQKQFSGSNILYHIDFHEQTLEAQGFIQVWQQPYSLEDFLLESEVYSKKESEQFSSKSVEVNGLHGYVWNYVISGDDQEHMKGIEAFLKKEDRMYRISYFVPENKWSKSHAEIFEGMVKSLKTY